jgi:hypothetical protein
MSVQALILISFSIKSMVMWKEITSSRFYGLAMILLLSTTLVNAQQNITIDKNNTRPEIDNQLRNPVIIRAFSAVRQNGYNEIRWSAEVENETRKYIVEFTEDGIHYQSAGELLTGKGIYDLKHQTFSMLPLLYRLRVEELNGRFYYTQNIMLEGIKFSPVKLYPTIITGNVINLIAGLPVERITIISGSGQQVFVQEAGGKTDQMTITIPSLARGMYFINFTGQGWKSSETFIIG